MQAAQVADLRSHGWQAEQLILQAFQFHKMTQDFHRKGMTLMDSYKDNHNHPVTDGVGEPKDKEIHLCRTLHQHAKFVMER